MDRIEVIDSTAKLKEVQLKHTNKNDQKTDMKKAIDDCYLESLQAKISILKNVVVKQ